MHVDYGECAKKGIDVFKDNALAFIVGSFIVVVGSVFVVTAPPLIAGLFYMADKGIKGRKVEVSDVFEGFNYLVPSMIYALIVCIGLLLFIVPGVIVLVVGIYAMPIIVLENADGMKAVKEALRMGKENILDVLGLSFMTLVLHAAGTAVFFAGQLITVPIAVIALTKAYRVAKG
ncbi:MAG: glycerophosphodiester phosphodiesterase [Candidatus Altiarchaeota archaeon]